MFCHIFSDFVFLPSVSVKFGEVVGEEEEAG